MRSRKTAIVLGLLAMLMLSGAQCTFIASSGDNDSDRDDEDKTAPGLRLILGVGGALETPVQGVSFVSAGVSGVTGPEGELQYEAGDTVQFSIGDLPLGEAVVHKSIVTPLDLVPGGTPEKPAVINIVRLLLSLDSQPGDTRITIPATLRSAAARSNDALSASLESLDYGDDAAFVNAASQLVATLTRSYPFTAVLVDADSARQYLQQLDVK